MKAISVRQIVLYKFVNSDFVHLYEDGTIPKITSDIYPPLTLRVNARFKMIRNSFIPYTVHRKPL